MSGLSWREAWRLSRLGGPDERLRPAMIAVSAALAVIPVLLGLMSLAVLSAWRGGYMGGHTTNPFLVGDIPRGDFGLAFVTDPNLMVGAAMALGLGVVTSLHLAVVSARIGGPARERRESALTAAGATTADLRRVRQSAITSWSLIGATVGGLVFLILWGVGRRPLIAFANAEDLGDGVIERTSGNLPLFPQVWPSPMLLVVGVLAVALGGAVLAAMPWARVSAVESRGWRSPSRVVAWVAGAVLTLLVLAFVLREVGLGPQPHVVPWPLVYITPVVILVFLYAVTPAVARALGRILASGGASGLIAGRALRAHPSVASRLSASLVLLGLVGGALVSIGGAFEVDLASEGVGGEGSRSSGDLYYLAPLWSLRGLSASLLVVAALGVLVVASELARSRRVGHARAIASGVPARTLRRALTLEAAVPAVVMGGIGLLLGLVVPAAMLLAMGRPEYLRGWSWALTALFAFLVVVLPFAATWVGARAIPDGDRALVDVRDR